MQLSKEEIKRVITNKQNYQLAETYLENADIESMVILCDASGEYNVDAYIIQGVYKNHVEIILDTACRVTFYSCSCPFCTAHSGCAHIGVVLMIIAIMEPRIFPYHFRKERFLARFHEYQEELETKRDEQKRMERQKQIEEQKARQLREYEEFKRKLQKEARKRMKDLTHHWLEKQWQKETQIPSAKGQQDVHLYVQLEEASNDYYTGEGYRCNVSFKISKGQKRQYVVKNIQDLIDAVDHEYYVSYGKELSFAHTMDHFDTASQEILKFTKENITTILYLTAGRKMAIHEDKLDEFYDLMQELPMSYRDFTLAEEKGKMSVDIEEFAGDYKMMLVSPKNRIINGKEHLYRVKGKALTRKCMNSRCLTLLKQLCEDDMWIAKEDMPKFQGYLLQQCRPYLSIKHKENLPVLIEEDYIQLFADMDEEGLINIKVECHMKDRSLLFAFENHTTLPVHLQLIEEVIKRYAQTVDYDKHIAYLDQEQETTFAFMQEGLPYLSKYCEIFVSDALRMLNEPGTMHLQVGIGMSNDLLQIDVSSIDVAKEELYEIFKAYRKKRKFYRLADGRLLSLENNELAEANQLLLDLSIDPKELKKETVQVPSYRSFHVEDIIQDEHAIAIQTKQSYVDYIHQYHQKQITLTPLASRYEKVLRDYQKEGVNWMQMLNHYHFGGILADDMGLGKTLQVIALLETMKQEQQLSLIVTPSSLLLNWEDEIKKFHADLRIQCVIGNAQTRHMQIMAHQEADVLITSYDYLKRDINSYAAIRFYYVILDEAQFIKNQKTKNAECVKQLQAQHRLALSGTPIENSLAELWSIFDFLMPGYLFNYHYFLTHFEKDIVQNHDEKKQQKLKKMVEPFILRRNKSKVLKELPDKIEHTLAIPFEEEEKKLYLANLAQVNKELRTHLQMERLDKFAILPMLTRLRQICCEPRILFEGMTNASSKMQCCLDLLETLRENKQKVLLFSSFTSVLDLLEDELAKRHFSYLKLTGSDSKQERREMVQKFQNGLTDVFLISLKAGGTGLNLTAASAVIHYDPWWNVSAQNQATDRAYRIGQNQNVQVYKLIMKESIEEKIQTLQKMKKDLSDHFVEDSDGSIYRMSYEDIVSLFDVS